LDGQANKGVYIVSI